ncbi:head-tail adaptor protein [Rhodobacterales bacterium HKCCE4037]|nr:head-tail adaptor protein [Rhodobacterales bacterium HKCCE4037]
MRAGALHERVAFDAPVAAPDGRGGVETTWGDAEDAVVTRASFRYLRGGETVQAARLSGSQPVVVTVRRSPATLGVTPDWRMRDVGRGDKVANIRSGPVVSDDRQWLEFTVEFGVAV